ncbi:MAG: nucleotide sugar dehydrogenase, partial [Nanoarchaeota archaeon]
MKIAVMGAGYVGLVTGACLANLGNDVICVDIDDERISNLRKGVIPFFEPGLRDLVEMNLAQRRLMFTTDSELAIRNSDVIFVAVGTPSDKDGKADISAVFAAAEHIARYMDSYKVIIVKSTVPVGTCHKLKEFIRQKQKKPVEFDVVSNPEFLREGEAVNDFMIPDRIVIGVDNGKARDVLLAIYKSIERTGRPILVTDVKSAELIKYAG